MKKIIFAVLLCMFFVGLNLAYANQLGEVYVVKKGDSIWTIATDIFHIPWPQVRPEVKHCVIYPGERITLDDLIDVSVKTPWRRFDHDPYRKYPVLSEEQLARDREGLKFRLNDEQIDELISKHIQVFSGEIPEGFRCDSVKEGDEFDTVFFGYSWIWIWRNVVVTWSGKKDAIVYILSDGIEIWYPIACGNWAIKKVEMVRPIEVVREVKGVPIEVAKRVEIGEPVKPAPSFPPAPVFPALIALDKFDFYIGSGIYESVHYDAQGYYLWSKIRYRPFDYKITDGLKLGLGLFAFGAIGEGNDDDYDYQWKKIVPGLTTKLIGYHWDADFDLGLWGRLWNKGNISSDYKNKQTDNIPYYLSTHLNLYSRRDKRKEWFPKTEFNLEIHWTESIEHKHQWKGNSLEPEPYDNRTFEMMANQAIYDFKPTGYVRLTPGFNLGFVREYGLDEPNFLQFGPRVTVHYYEDIISISFLNYKKQLEGDGHQWHWVSCWINIIGLIEAIKTSQIR